MKATKSVFLRYLADAVRGVHAPFGGARHIEYQAGDFQPRTSSTLIRSDGETLDRAAHGWAVSLTAPVLSWTDNKGEPVVLTLQDLRGFEYRGSGTFALANGASFQLWSDQPVVVSDELPGLTALVHALKGDDSETQEAIGFVRLTSRGMYEDFIEFDLLNLAILETAIHCNAELLRALKESPQGVISVIVGKVRTGEHQVSLRLEDLISVMHLGKGVFRLRGTDYQVFALRPIQAEVRRQDARGELMPRMHIVPPARVEAAQTPAERRAAKLKSLLH